MGIVKEVPEVKPEAINKFTGSLSNVIRVKAKLALHIESAAVSDDPQINLCYQDSQPYAHGSFGIVFKAKQCNTGQFIAVKKVLQDKRYKNRELEISRVVDHPNVLKLKYYFYTYGKVQNEIYLGLVYEYIPDTLHLLSNTYKKSNKPMPKLEVKVFAYQVLRGLVYMHSHGICHRDIKPQNILVNPTTRVVRICDFGSAKILKPDEKSIPYICSRYYRAPELLFSAAHYGCKIDVWSAACVVAELILTRPLFTGDNWVDQLAEIMKILGPPTAEDVLNMNPDYGAFDFPSVTPCPWTEVFGKLAKEDEIEFFEVVLLYSPGHRPTAFECLALRYFDELRIEGNRFENGDEFPQLFNFTDHELKVQPELNNIVNPSWHRPAPAIYVTPQRAGKADPEGLSLVNAPRRPKRSSRFLRR